MDALNFSHEKGVIKLQKGQKIGWGVAMPYPGFSKETRKEAWEQIDRLGPAFLKEKIPLNQLFPSVQFAFHCALTDLKNPDKPFTCKVQGLYQPAKDMDGFDVIKVKVGHLSLSEAVETINSLPIRQRIDFNQKWNIEDVYVLCEKIDMSKIDYLEEPTKDLQVLQSFPHPIAFDETLQNPPDLSAFPTLVALVLKPTLLGDITPFLSLGFRTVLSSCFEGELGVRCLKKMAGRLGLEDEYHGLDTL